MLWENEPETQENEHEDDQEETGGCDDDIVTQEEWDDLFADENDMELYGF